jgi:hypothetical protein
VLKSDLFYSVNLVLYYSITLKHILNKLYVLDFLLLFVITVNNEALELIVNKYQLTLNSCLQI